MSIECGYTVEKVPVPRIGSMTVESEADIATLFHGARQMRGNAIRNDVITSTFDPATLNCVTCSGTHEIMSSTAPPQSFLVIKILFRPFHVKPIPAVLRLLGWKTPVFMTWLI
jgi:hypothetical protein